jgi:hypothetical protein
MAKQFVDAEIYALDGLLDAIQDILYTLWKNNYHLLFVPLS